MEEDALLKRHNLFEIDYQTSIKDPRKHGELRTLTALDLLREILVYSPEHSNLDISNPFALPNDVAGLGDYDQPFDLSRNRGQLGTFLKTTVGFGLSRGAKWSRQVRKVYETQDVAENHITLLPIPKGVIDFRMIPTSN
jgi:hypothetical protein